MSRVKTGTTRRKRHKKYLDAAKGYRGARSRTYRIARHTVERAWCFAYRDRKQKKRQFRSLWITRISAFCRENGTSYSVFMNQIKRAGLELDRKILSHLASYEPETLKEILSTVQKLDDAKEN